MITESCISLTMRHLCPACPLREPERIAGFMPARDVQHGTQMGSTIPLPCETEAEPDNFHGSLKLSLQGTLPVKGCGIFPAIAGNVAGSARILHTH